MRCIDADQVEQSSLDALLIVSSICFDTSLDIDWEDPTDCRVLIRLEANQHRANSSVLYFLYRKYIANNLNKYITTSQ